MHVLVTGGTGLVGSAIKKLQPNWVYLSSYDGDLTDFETVQKLLLKHQPEAIIHLAANVGGLFKNEAHKLEMFNSNLVMNYNVLENAYRLGIKRVICCLSTCIFPDGLNRVLTETDLHLGEPHNSNYGYAYAKRIMEVQCRLYNETPGFFYQCVIPTNIYGPHDNFHLTNSHVIPALIHKAYLHALTDKNAPFVIQGTGLPKRQFIYSEDLAVIITNLLLKNITTVPLLICSSDEKDEITILEVARLIANHFEIMDVRAAESVNRQHDGQLIKTVCCDKMRQLFSDLELMPIEKGLHTTIEWFIQNYPNIRL